MTRPRGMAGLHHEKSILPQQIQFYPEKTLQKNLAIVIWKATLKAQVFNLLNPVASSTALQFFSVFLLCSLGTFQFNSRLFPALRTSRFLSHAHQP
jgi:hypothetical protein